MDFIDDSSLTSRVREELRRKLLSDARKLDKIFAWSLGAQWVALTVVAFLSVPPETTPWTSPSEFWLPVSAGSLCVLLPALLVCFQSGSVLSRQSVSVGQAILSVLFLYVGHGQWGLSAHVFVATALLVAYRDRTVFIAPAAITAVCHAINYIFEPVPTGYYRVLDATTSLSLLTWLLVEVIGLSYIVRENLKQCVKNASLQTALQDERDHLEARVAERTKKLSCLQQFRDEILNSIDASICILGAQGQLVFVNEQWKQLADECGIAKSSDLGSLYLKHCNAIFGNQEFVELVGSYIRLVAIGESDAFWTEHSALINGRHRHFRLSITPVLLEHEIGVAVVHVDVTESRRNERRAEALAKLVQESPDEVLIAQVKSGKFIEANEGVTKNTGYSRDQLLDMELWEIFDPASGSEVREALFKTATRIDSVARFESQIKRKDGSEYPCRISLHQTPFEDTDVWVFFITDLTEHKQLEIKLQQAQKLESLGTLAAGIAHEINTPMQCVVGNFEFLQNSFTKLTALSDRMVDLLDASSVDWSVERQQLQQLRRDYRYDFLRKQTPMALEEAADSSRRIVTIVRAMKAMSHPGTDEAVETDLHELIQNASIISRNRWKYVAEMSFNLSPEMPKLLAFPAELNQVFINLFVNATDAIIERLGADPSVLGLIAVDTRLEDDTVIIRVRDTGCGISEKHRSRIFDPFFTTKPVGKGTGQGLAISHSVIVNKHHGTISVASEVGIGTIFTITLPVNANHSRSKLTIPTAAFQSIEARHQLDTSVN